MHKKNIIIKERKSLPRKLMAQDFSLDISLLNYRAMCCNTPRLVNEPFYRTFDFYCISHMVGGKGVFWHNDIMTEVHPGQAIIICPDFVHDFFGLGESYIEDTIDFTGTGADYFRQKGIITSGIISMGTERRLMSIINDYVSINPISQIHSKLNLINLLLETKSPHLNGKSDNKHYHAIDNLIRKVCLNPEKWWTVSEMAELCELSQVQFRRVFLYYSGKTPKNFIEEVKLKAAARKMLDCDHPICQLAQQFNYHDQFHFSRRFKKIFGINPSEYREK